MNSASYVGRFAPSPTGPLHYGSLLAAMASYCDARANQGRWLLRIDDIDPPRTAEGAATGIERTLKHYGFEWDGNTQWQSSRTTAYLAAIGRLNDKSVLYPCSCSRKALANAKVYPGHCLPRSNSESWAQAQEKIRSKLVTNTTEYAIRAHLKANTGFTDLVQSEQRFNALSDLGDTIVLRRDNLFAYALACAVDDSDGISHVVRGQDLQAATGVQIAIMALLNKKAPQYAHIPLAMNSSGEKLSKQTKAPALDALPVLPTLLQAWQHLGQDSLNANSVGGFWSRAVVSWQLAKVPKQSQLGGAL